ELPAYGVLNHQNQGDEGLRFESVYSDLDTASAVGYAFRLLLSLKRDHFEPSATPFSFDRPTSVFESKYTFLIMSSYPPPSVTVFFATLIVVSRIAFLKASSKLARKPASASYSL